MGLSELREGVTGWERRPPRRKPEADHLKMMVAVSFCLFRCRDFSQNRVPVKSVRKKSELNTFGGCWKRHRGDCRDRLS